MRLATVIIGDEPRVAVMRDDRCVPLDPALGIGSIRELAAAGDEALEAARAWADRQRGAVGSPIAEFELGPAVPDAGAIYTIGLNYVAPDEPPGSGPQRPLVYGKAATSIAGHGAVLSWDRSLTANVDPECELGIVIGREATDVPAERSMDHVFGYTCINDISSRDPWLDGDQWLVGKSMPGFCPVGPWVVTADEITPDDLRLGCTINGVAIQDGSTAQMRFAIPELIAYLSRHLTLRPGDLVATGTPMRLAGPLGPDRHLEAGDEVTVWIESIGALTTVIA